MGYPLGVVQIPADGAAEAFFKGYRLVPVEFLLQFGAVYGIAAVVAGAVLNKGDEFPEAFLGGSAFFGYYIDERIEQFDVFPFVFAADVVFFAYPPLLHHQPHGAVVVFHIEPIPDVFAVPIDWEGFSFPHVQDHQGDKFFRELVGAVVVGTVGQGNGEAVGVVVGQNQVVASGLAGRIGRAGVVGRSFRKVAAFAEASVHFVGGNMMKEHRRIPQGPVAFLPRETGHIEERIGSQHIGGHKGFGAQNGAVHVALGGKVDHRINLVLLKDLFHGRPVPDIRFDKDIPGLRSGAVLFRDIGEAFAVPRIGQGIQIDDPARKVRTGGEKVAHHVGADKAGAAGYQDGIIMTHSSFL